METVKTGQEDDEDAQMEDVRTVEIEVKVDLWSLCKQELSPRCFLTFSKPPSKPAHFFLPLIFSLISKPEMLEKTSRFPSKFYPFDYFELMG